jgi:outer membrane protein OmpA-like peptidoglycan-associated protein
MLSRRILRHLAAGEIADMIAQVVWSEPGSGADSSAAHCRFSQLSSQLVQGQLHRVGADITETVIVDGRAVSVPILHARADFVSILDNFRMQGDMWFVDDSVAPWVTRIEMTRQDGRTFHMALGTVSTPAAGAALERALTDSCRAPVYGFYFPFNRADVEPASAPTFRAVADLLGRHPDWTLAIEGHTDSIGDPAGNLRLSERRAAAVRQQLVTQYGVASARLTAAGRGMSGYVAPNNTLAGRARNRRVDLVRRCGG